MNQPTLKEVQKKAEEKLSSSRVCLPRLESHILLAHALKIPIHEIYIREDDFISEEEYSHIQKMIQLKQENMPTAYIINSKEFWGRDFCVDQNVLIPRPETEELVELILQRNPTAQNVLDLGCGSGCIGITLSLEMNIEKIILSDISLSALKVCQKNTQLLGLSSTRWNCVESDLFESNEIKNEKFDFVVSNPPYIPPEEMSSLMVSVREYEPPIALQVPDPGFEERLIFGAFEHLKKGGWFYWENHPSRIGHSAKMMRRIGFQEVCIQKDLSQKDRFLYGIKHESV